MSTKRILAIIGSVIIIGSFIFGVTWACLNAGKISQVFSGVNLYTKEDLDKSYQDGYNVAKQDNQELQDIIEKLRQDLDKLSQDKGLLEQEKIDLQNQIKVYEDLVKKFNKLIATFYVDGKVYAVQDYDPGQTIYIPNPPDTIQYRFNCWTLNGENVQANGYVINEHVTFEANITYKHEVRFNHDYETQFASVLNDPLLNLSDAHKKSLEYNNDKMSVGSGFGVSSSVYVCDGDYLSNGLGFLYMTTYILRESNCYSFVGLKKVNYRYICYVENIGWKFNGELIDIDNFVITEDGVLTPVYQLVTFAYKESDFKASGFESPYDYYINGGEVVEDWIVSIGVFESHVEYAEVM